VWRHHQGRPRGRALRPLLHADPAFSGRSFSLCRGAPRGAGARELHNCTSACSRRDDKAAPARSACADFPVLRPTPPHKPCRGHPRRKPHGRWRGGIRYVGKATVPEAARGSPSAGTTSRRVRGVAVRCVGRPWEAREGTVDYPHLRQRFVSDWWQGRPVKVFLCVRRLAHPRAGRRPNLGKPAGATWFLPIPLPLDAAASLPSTSPKSEGLFSRNPSRKRPFG
jgi:hypothetical protein